MRGTLVLAILTIRSSYLRNVEETVPDDGRAPDTVQWWIAPTGTWRIKTFALDHDIHTHSIGIGDVAQTIELALTNTRKHYGDVTRSQHVIELADFTDEKATNAAFQASGLEARIEISAGRFAFWKPDDGRYYTQSEPR